MRNSPTSPGGAGGHTPVPPTPFLGPIAVALFAGSVALYANSLPNPYANLDDAVYVGENPKVLDGLTVENIHWAFTTGAAANYHPLTWLSFQLDATVWGLIDWAEQPATYRLTNLLLHGANAALLFLVLRRLTGATGPSLATAAVWAVHPLHVESVVWITERKDVLSQFFGLLAVAAYVRYVDRPSTARMAGVAGLMVLSLAGKPMFVTLPCVLLLLDFWPLRRETNLDWDAWRPLVAEKWPLFAAAVGWSVLAWAVQSRAGATAGNDVFPLSVRVANAAQSYVAYLGQTVWPTGLAPFYPYLWPRLSDPRTILALVILVAITVGCFRLRNCRPYLLVGWLWFLGTLVPTIGLVQVGDQSRADRYTYLPQVGLIFAGVWAMADLLGRWLGAVTAIGVTLCLAIAAYAQAQLWRDNIRLWQHALAVTIPENYKAHECLAGSLVAARRPEEAIAHARAALGPSGVNAGARVSLGMALVELGKRDEALSEFTIAAQQSPTMAFPQLLLGQMLLRFGLADQALPKLMLTGQTTRMSEAAEAILAGRKLLADGKPGPAREQLFLALKKYPGLAEPQYLLGQCAEAEGKFDEAVARYREAARILPDYPPPYARLALVLADRGDYPRAVAAGEKAAALRPESVNYRAGLGRVYSAAGRTADAQAQYAEATRIDPGWANRDAEFALTALARPGPTTGLLEATVLATAACEATNYGRAMPLAALAAARAAEGRFGAAADLATKAAGLAERPDEAAAFRNHAATYRAGKTLREYIHGGG